MRCRHEQPVQLSVQVGFHDKGDLFTFRYGIHQVFWDTCSWQGQLDRTRSWKASVQVGKSRAKLAKTSELGTFLLKLESLAAVGKFK